MIPIRKATAPHSDIRAAITLLNGIGDYRDGTVTDEAVACAEKLAAEARELIE